MHKLLERQMRRMLADTSLVPTDFLRAIDAAYAQADEDRRLLERAMELTSEELLHRNNALNRSLALLRATLESTDEGILVIGRGRQIETYNQRFVTLWNHPLDILERRDGEASSRHAVTQVVDPDAFIARLEEIYVRPDLEGFDEIELRNGCWLERYTRPMRHDGNVLGRVWSFRDITEKRRLEEQIRQSQKMEAVGQLAGGIAHDFNNLLTVITGSCELSLRRSDDSDPIATKLLGEIANAARRASDLTSQLLAFSRHEVIAQEALLVDASIREVEGMLHRLIRENIELKTSLAAGTARILADRGRFHQIILNLVINASDALARGGEIEIFSEVVGSDEARRALSTESDAGAVVIRVRDNGVGIPQDIQQRIFDPFFTTKAPGQGTGLGLATVYGIVGQFGGAIELDSTPGEGTEFRLTFPVTDAPLAAADAQTTLITDEDLRGTILAVEDDPAVRLILVEMLSLMDGFDIHVAASPEEALEQFGRPADGDDGRLDLLISDIVMPNMNGFELSEILLDHHPELKILFVSGYDPTSPDFRRGEEIRHAAFLSKPFDSVTLETKIYDVLVRSPQPIDAEHDADRSS